MIKKVISAVLAVSFVSSVFITAYAADTEKAKKYFKPADLSGMFDFMTGKSSDKAPENLDVNEDGVVNILDTISMKESIYEDHSYYKHVLSSSDYEKDINDSQKLNRMAETVSEVVTDAIREGKAPGADFGTYFTYDDESELADSVNSILLEKYGYRDMKWKAMHTGFRNADVVCAVNNEKTGAYPVGIPDDITLPFDKVDLSSLKMMEGSDADWHNYFCTSASLNEYARQLSHFLYAIIRNSINKGKYSFSGKQYFDSDSSDEISVLFNKYISMNTNGKYISKWALLVEDGEVRSFIVTDISEKVTGAYPEAVPQSLEIPFFSSMHEYASGEKKWKDDFSDCISSKPEIASLPDYAEISESEGTMKAFNVFWFMEYYHPDALPEIKDGVYDFNEIKEDLQKSDNEKMIYLPELLFNHEQMLLTFSEGNVTSVRYKNECGLDITVTIDMYNEAMAEEPERVVTSSGGGSRTVSTKVINLNDEEEKVKVPDPDHHLYYSTDADGDDNTVIRLRTEEELKESSEETSRGWTVTIPEADQNFQS